MLKLLIPTLLCFTALHAGAAKDTYQFHIDKVTFDYTFKCEPKIAKWWQVWIFTPIKDEANDRYCKGRGVGTVDISSGGWVKTGHGPTGYSGDIAAIPSSAGMFKAIKASNFYDPSNGITGGESLFFYLSRVKEKISFHYHLYRVDPNGNKDLIDSGTAVPDAEISTDKPYQTREYTDTYDIDSMRECIDGQVWVKKYGKKSGKPCQWKLLDSPVRGEK